VNNFLRNIRQCRFGWVGVMLAVLILSVLVLPLEAAEVKNIVIQKVENRLLFTYDLEGEEDVATVSVYVTVGDKTYPAKSLRLEGDLGKVRPGRNRRIVWYVLNDFPGGVNQPVSVEIFTGLQKIINNIGMTFLLLPAGSVVMGSPADEPGRNTDEMQERVTISRAFYLQTTEVTQGQWKRVMGTNPSRFSDCGEDCPVEQVSWHDTQAFIRKLNDLEGTNRYRLPTEAEWEYAARAGTATAYFWGKAPDCSRANYGNSLWGSECKGANPGKTVKVGSFRPNTWGLYDMAGNVWEWVDNWYGPYNSSQITNPDVPRSGVFQVQRGGAWDSDAAACRTALRVKALPEVKLGHLKLNPGNLGFRLARTAE
jgi:formylglycine-generating enzyme required for sulfatase activity